MRRFHRSGICILALIAGSAALQFEPTVVRDLVSDSGNQRVVIGAVRTSLWSAAFAQSTDSVTLENVSFTFGGASYDAKRIILSGVASSRADIDALLSSASTEPMAARLARINAKRIEIPEIKLKQQLGKETQTASYKNVVIDNVVQGRIASAAIETVGVEMTGPQGSGLVSTGRSTISDLDMPALAALYETKADSASAPLAKIYGAFSIDSMEVIDNQTGLSFKIGHMSGRDFMARPTKDSWAGTSALLAELGDKEKPAPEETARVLTLAADIMGAFDIGFVEAVELEFKAPPEKTKGTGAPSGRIGRIAYTGAVGSQPAAMRMDGLEIADQNARVKIDAVSLTGFSFAPTLDGLRVLEGKSLKDLDHATARTLIPTLGTLRLSGLDLDISGSSPKTQDRVRVTVEDYEITADKPVNGLPTNIRIAQRNAVMALPSNSKDEFVRQLAALGYKTFDSSFTVSAQWNEAANEIALKEVSVEAKDMGSLSLTGLLGNVSRDLFSADQATAGAALVGVKAQSADLVVEDKGLFERYLAQAAKEQKTKPESLQRLYALAAPMVLSSMIGNSAQAKELSKAVSDFIAQPGKLTIHAQPKNPSGFGILDVMLASDPKAALDKLNITAKVE